MRRAIHGSPREDEEEELWSTAYVAFGMDARDLLSDCLVALVL
jgi:hypothetical protein